MFTCSLYQRIRIYQDIFCRNRHFCRFRQSEISFFVKYGELRPARSYRWAPKRGVRRGAPPATSRPRGNRCRGSFRAILPYLRKFRHDFPGSRSPCSRGRRRRGLPACQAVCGNWGFSESGKGSKLEEECVYRVPAENGCFPRKRCRAHGIFVPAARAAFRGMRAVNGGKSMQVYKFPAGVPAPHPFSRGGSQ